MTILNEIKQMLGIEADDTAFDNDLIPLINSNIMVLRQVGVGPQSGFNITSTSTWEDYLGTYLPNLAEAKEYIFLRVKLVFDPPASSSACEALKKRADELEWRAMIDMDI